MLQVIQIILLLSACICTCINAAPPHNSLTLSRSVLQSLAEALPQNSEQRASDLFYTPIKTVTDATRYTVKNPSVNLVALNKVKHVKGNIVFSAGERIPGDKLMANHYDDESFTTSVDIEVEMRYPSASGTSITLTCIEIYVDTTAEDANAYFISGGIGKNQAEILLASNLTRTFSYEAYFYGY